MYTNPAVAVAGDQEIDPPEIYEGHQTSTVRITLSKA